MVDAPAIQGGNGDGNLLYPGTPDRIGGQSFIPIASVRLKQLRDGMEDNEYSLSFPCFSVFLRNSFLWCSTRDPAGD